VCFCFRRFRTFSKKGGCRAPDMYLSTNSD
jgi:hypothetical protein